MIASMCANPCVDRTVSIEKFTYGGMNRIREQREDGSSKGVNVALASAQLGMGAVCLGFMPVERNGLILSRLEQEGCETDFVQCMGAVRVNTKILDQSTGVITELNQSGPPVTGTDVEEIMKKAMFWASRCSFLVMAGSTPPGCPVSLYYDVAMAVRKANPQCRVVLDAEGDRFALGLGARPFMVKPNRYELELLCGRKLDSIQDVHAEALGLINRGVSLVAVSMGGDGAYITDGKLAYSAPALNVPVKSTVGAGDSMVVGLLLGLESMLPLKDVFRYGMAAAASSVTTLGTGLINRALFQEYLNQVDVRQVS